MRYSLIKERNLIVRVCTSETTDSPIFVRYVGRGFCKSPLLYRLTPGVTHLNKKKKICE